MQSIEVSCTCRPSPPGGTTRCEGGQIAICGDGGSGICQGSCVSVDPNLTSLQYTAELLSAVVGANLTDQDLESDAEAFALIVKRLLKSSLEEKTVSFTLDGQLYHASVGLTDVAKTKLEQAVQLLANTRQPAYRTI